jgi:catechol 2,3-dioxygenase-like lactoylglutathione lyase family enzyme
MKKSILISMLCSLWLMACTKKENNLHDLSASAEIPLPSDTIHLQIWREKMGGAYPVFITRQLQGTKKFYQQWLGYQIIFESTWFILLTSPGENPTLIAFMDEEHPSTPPSPKVFKGDGAFYTLDVRDASGLYNAMKKAGATFAYHLKDEPWGQRRFAITDPNGIWIDVVEQIAPQPGWWDQYIPK